MLGDYLVTMFAKPVRFVACYVDSKSIALSLSGILEAGMLVCQDWQKMRTGEGDCERLSL